ncbi:peptidoglycan DD-metalloendopeptidase family protein [Flavobacterium sp. ZT3R18]|uniref:murein hydrolase activator EnvC family protein n=1 Tax=Flavobacterium sp. ZT3R18 TaxID=2594429 RepID=UPI00117B3C65|nr:peptidoglycan DD-metalloendopeptidase family protein [Flavobacterium sp. ZT3R18]TRX37916.1 peptidoglycan DD-metalloendopeptidase family protein [Flavobacterium sp. ZT3R18]
MPKFFISLIFLFATSVLWSQESQQAKLEAQKAKIQKEIRENETKLQTVKKQEKTATKAIVLQSNKIKLKEELISTTEKQTKLLGNSISVNQAQINKLENELKLLKEDYAKMIVKSYKSRSEESRAMFILSSESFLQAYKRMQYMKQYTNYRKTQGQEIQSKTNVLYTFNAKLDIKKNAKEQLITENNKERLSLEKEKIEQQKLVDSLKKDKNKIIAEIKKKQKESRGIDKKIDRLIREAIAEANRKAAREKAAKDKAKADAIAKANAIANAIAKAKAIEKAKAIAAANAIAAAKAKANSKPIPKPIPIPKEVAKAIAKAEPSVAPVAVSSTKIELTSDGKVDSDNFKANKGKLPWPVEKGHITLGYGDQAHPLYKTLVIHNSGLEFGTDSGANARAVFAGVVTSVIIISPVNKLVMLQHGDFFTIYQNLSSVNVSKGDKVSIRQSLGKIKTNGDGKTILKFAITQNTNYTNPKTWLVGK